MPNELLPCPFCGGAPSLEAPSANMAADCGDVVVRCTDCDALGASFLAEAGEDTDGRWPDVEAEAITAWNTRPTLSHAGGDLVERALLMARSWINNHDQMCVSFIPSDSADGPPNKCSCSLPERMRVIDGAIDHARAALQSIPPVAAPSDERTVEVVRKAIATKIGGMFLGDTGNKVADELAHVAIQAHLSCLPGQVGHGLPAALVKLGYQQQIDKARKQALEEAAKVADDFPSLMTGPAIAHRIRALSTQQEDQK